MGIFNRMMTTIRRKVIKHEQGLYTALIFPIAFAFILTFAGSRVFSHFWPQIYLEASPGLHVHHFTYGFFILALAGYLALIFNGPKAKFWISMLLGFGLGLAMDEFGMWLKLKDDDITRWSYDGFNVIMAFFFFLLTFKPGIRLLRVLWPFK